MNRIGVRRFLYPPHVALRPWVGSTSLFSDDPQPGPTVRDSDQPPQRHATPHSFWRISVTETEAFGSAGLTDDILTE